MCWVITAIKWLRVSKKKKGRNQRGAIGVLQHVKLAQLNISQNALSCMFQVRLDNQGDSCERLGGQYFLNSDTLLLVILLVWDSGWAFNESTFPWILHLSCGHPPVVGWILLYEFGSDTVTIHAAGEKEEVYYLHNEIFWGEQGRLSSRLENGFRGQRKDIHLGFYGGQKVGLGG